MSIAQQAPVRIQAQSEFIPFRPLLHLHDLDSFYTIYCFDCTDSWLLGPSERLMSVVANLEDMFSFELADGSLVFQPVLMMGLKSGLEIFNRST